MQGTSSTTTAPIVVAMDTLKMDNKLSYESNLILLILLQKRIRHFVHILEFVSWRLAMVSILEDPTQLR